MVRKDTRFMMQQAKKCMSPKIYVIYLEDEFPFKRARLEEYDINKHTPQVTH